MATVGKSVHTRCKHVSTRPYTYMTVVTGDKVTLDQGQSGKNVAASATPIGLLSIAEARCSNEFDKGLTGKKKATPPTQVIPAQSHTPSKCRLSVGRNV
jgi:hypothetical protein